MSTDTDKELLTLAAKAAGIVGLRFVPDAPESSYWDSAYPGHKYPDFHDMHTGKWLKGWNPLSDSADALNLAIKLHICVSPYVGTFAMADAITGDCAKEDYGNDPCAAVRRAIVRCAAEIGRSTKEP